MKEDWVPAIIMIVVLFVLMFFGYMTAVVASMFESPVVGDLLGLGLLLGTSVAIGLGFRPQ